MERPDVTLQATWDATLPEAQAVVAAAVIAAFEAHIADRIRG